MTKGKRDHICMQWNYCMETGTDDDDDDDDDNDDWSNQFKVRELVYNWLQMKLRFLIMQISQ